MKKRSNLEGNIRFFKSRKLYEGRLTVKGKTKSRVEVAEMSEFSLLIQKEIILS